MRDSRDSLMYVAETFYSVGSYMYCVRCQFQAPKFVIGTICFNRYETKIRHIFKIVELNLLNLVCTKRV